MVKHCVHSIRSRCICRFDEPCVNIRCRAGLSVSKPSGNRDDGNMSRYQQAGVCMAQAVDSDRREIVFLHELRKPSRDPVQVEGRSIPSSEKQVILYSFFVLDLYSLRPRCASLAPDTVLIELVFFQHIKTVLAHLKGTV